jgi:hypothetical protein
VQLEDAAASTCPIEATAMQFIPPYTLHFTVLSNCM